MEVVGSNEHGPRATLVDDEFLELSKEVGRGHSRQRGPIDTLENRATELRYACPFLRACFQVRIHLQLVDEAGDFRSSDRDVTEIDACPYEDLRRFGRCAHPSGPCEGPMPVPHIRE